MTRLRLLAALANRLHDTFKGSTGVDLDRLAAELVDELVDPLVASDYNDREAMFAAALRASMDYASGRIGDLNGEVRTLQQDNDRLAVLLRESRDAKVNA